MAGGATHSRRVPAHPQSPVSFLPRPSSRSQSPANIFAPRLKHFAHFYWLATARPALSSSQVACAQEARHAALCGPQPSPMPLPVTNRLLARRPECETVPLPPPVRSSDFITFNTPSASHPRCWPHHGPGPRARHCSPASSRGLSSRDAGCARGYEAREGRRPEACLTVRRGRPSSATKQTPPYRPSEHKVCEKRARHRATRSQSLAPSGMPHASPPGTRGVVRGSGAVGGSGRGERLQAAPPRIFRRRQGKGPLTGPRTIKNRSPPASGGSVPKTVFFTFFSRF